MFVSFLKTKQRNKKQKTSTVVLLENTKIKACCLTIVSNTMDLFSVICERLFLFFLLIIIRVLATEVLVGILQV